MRNEPTEFIAAIDGVTLHGDGEIKVILIVTMMIILMMVTVIMITTTLMMIMMRLVHRM